MNKIWDVVPAYGLSRYVAKMAYSLTGIVYCDAKKIEVKEAPSDMQPFGTTDGQSYHMNPARDEAINDWTEKH
jgi:hypothetical protein